MKSSHIEIDSPKETMPQPECLLRPKGSCSVPSITATVATALADGQRSPTNRGDQYERR